MAKVSIVKTIRAKPNQRGVTSHIPFKCFVKDCDEEVLLVKGPFEKRIKACRGHHENPPQSRAAVKARAQLKSLGLIF